MKHSRLSSLTTCLLVSASMQSVRAAGARSFDSFKTSGGTTSTEPCSQPITTGALAESFCVTFHYKVQPDKKYQYAGVAGPNSVVWFRDDGSVYLKSGWVFVRHAAFGACSAPPPCPCTSQPAAAQPAWRVVEPVTEDWVVTSRITAGAEGSNILVWIDPDSDDHKMILLDGNINGGAQPWLKEVSDCAQLGEKGQEKRWGESRRYYSTTQPDGKRFVGSDPRKEFRIACEFIPVVRGAGFPDAAWSAVVCDRSNSDPPHTSNAPKSSTPSNSR